VGETLCFLVDKRVRQRKKPVHGSWRMDETYIQLNGKWVYLYRAVDKQGNTIDFLLRARKDAVAQKPSLERLSKKMEDITRSRLIRAGATKRLNFANLMA
jgi:putative transposase